MIEPAIIFVRLVQYAGAAILGGSSLFCIYAAPHFWPRSVLAGAACVLAAMSLLSVGLQGSLLAGSLADGFTRDTIGQVLAYLPMGKAALLRAALSVTALALLMLPDRSLARLAVACSGAGTAASLAWMGHGGAAETSLQLGADVIHVLAAACWIGALAGLTLMATRASGDEDIVRLRMALHVFSAVGVPLVALVVLSGLANSWYLVGLAHVRDLPGSPYGRLLLAKLWLVGAMLGLAALNRYCLAPNLSSATLGKLWLSIVTEALLGFGVLALVAWFGTLEPPAAL